ncbi:MAG: hypothetical protein QNK32_05645, partial [Porticoccus sp.]|nr:hypothetical protein [Porticoccus sp.]
MTILQSNSPFGEKLGLLLRNGKSLDDHRNGILARSAETGHYNGIKTLEFKERDPIGYERIFSKVRAGLVNSREVA